MTRKPLRIAVCNHWSFIGIGWQLGLESCALSVRDAVALAEQRPPIRVCVNQDAVAYELLARDYPSLARRLARHLRAGRIELIGGTYAQPHGTTISGESNVRQVAWGRLAIRRALRYDVRTFLEQEEFAHPQVPQILGLSGYRFAGLAQADTWGAAGAPIIERNVVAWQGIDGTVIPALPKYADEYFTAERRQLASSRLFEALREQGAPLVACWEEFGWEPPGEPLWPRKLIGYRSLAEGFCARFLTVGQYLEEQEQAAGPPVRLAMDDWSKLLAWGIGGDQLRIRARTVEQLLLAAERFDAVAAIREGRSERPRLEEAWKHLLTSQSHDAALCEYSRWQGTRMPSPEAAGADPGRAWGMIARDHLAQAQTLGAASLERALHRTAARIAAPRDGRSLLVFNPSPWERTGPVEVPQIRSLPRGAQGVMARTADGRPVPVQLIREERDGGGALVSAAMLVLADAVPAVGYAAHLLSFPSEPVPPLATDLRIDEQGFTMANRHLALAIDPATGAIRSLATISSGAESLDAERGTASPVIWGTPNADAVPEAHLQRSGARAGHFAEPFDTSRGAATLSWIERGPVRATVLAVRDLGPIVMETRVGISAGSPRAEIATRLLCRVPPLADAQQPGWPPFPIAIRNGYWMSIATGFPRVEVVRDYPFGIEPSTRDAFHALSFVDIVGGDRGLLVLHPGTQYFRWTGDRVLANLLVREWESAWTGEFGWPRCAAYRHALLPHGPGFGNAERGRAAAEFSEPLLPLVDPPPGGRRRGGSRAGAAGGTDAGLPPRHGFLSVEPASVQLSAFRMAGPGTAELRVVEMTGAPAGATVRTTIPVSETVETDLLGGERGRPAPVDGSLEIPLQPWKIRTFRLR